MGIKSNLTEKEKKFIEMQSTLEGWDDARIAKELGRNLNTIRKYRRSASITKDSAGKVKTNLVPQDLKEDKKKEQYKVNFYASDRLKRMKKHLAPEDLDYFADRWAEYHIQMPDMTATEEDAMEKMILLDIRIMYNQKSMRECHLVQEKLRNEMSNKEELDPENDRDLQIIHTIDAMNAQEIELNKQYAVLIKEYKDIQKTFNATREQREQNQKIGADTFFDLVKKFQNEDVRRESGRLNELMRISKDRKLKELMQPHKYVDGSYDLPILDGKEMKKQIKEEKRKEKEQENV